MEYWRQYTLRQVLQTGAKSFAYRRHRGHSLDITSSSLRYVATSIQTYCVDKSYRIDRRRDLEEPYWRVY